MIYHVVISTSAEKSLEKIPKKDRMRIIDKIDELESDPLLPSCKKLKGYKDLYRIRSGDYRIVYSIKNDILVVLVVDIGHRKDIYR